MQAGSGEYSSVPSASKFPTLQYKYELYYFPVTQSVKELTP